MARRRSRERGDTPAFRRVADDDLGGSAPDSCPVALLLVDVVNDLDFDGGRRLLARALPMATRLAALAARARRERVPVIWVNDNFGRWRSDFRGVIQHCARPGVLGREIVERVAPPAADDYFVLKPKHSGFFNTSLELLLQHLGTRVVVLTGMATEVCVLFTANDAHMRGLKIAVVRDGVASSDARGHTYALALMRSALGARLLDSARIDFAALGRDTPTRTRRAARRPPRGRRVAA